ncbi:unnamed protein product [Closterium sp. NIES-54]
MPHGPLIRVFPKNSQATPNDNSPSYVTIGNWCLAAGRQAGLDVAHIGTHSFRQGAATAAASLGVPDRLFKRMGRWRSDSAKEIPQLAQCVVSRSMRPRALPVATRSLQPRAASHHTQPSGRSYLLLAACRLPAACCLPLLPAACLLLAACCLPAACCLLQPACCLPAACLLTPDKRRRQMHAKARRDPLPGVHAPTPG